jgi:hypothetical protein
MDSKAKIDESNDIIKNLEKSLFNKQQLLETLKFHIIEIAQIFENKKIDEFNYPLPSLLEVSLDYELMILLVCQR